MSQNSSIKSEEGAVKIEPGVKVEPGISGSPIPPASASSTATSGASTPGPDVKPSPSSFKSDQGWQDIPLKACTEEEVKDIRYHILKFQTKQNVDIVNNFTKPVRLHRKDPRNIQFQLTRQEIEQRKKEQEEAKRERERIKKENDEKKAKELEEIEAAEAAAAFARGEKRDDIKNNISATGIGLVNPDPPKKPADGGADMSQVAPDGGARKARKNVFKRKTRQINLMDDEKRKLRYEEYYPWVLEDYDGKNVFVGNYEAGSSDTQHVLFVFDKDGFKMVPAEKVYKFTPRNKYATLTLEEAEAKMEKNSSVPRWLMKHMEDQSHGGPGEATTDQRFRHSTGSSSSNIIHGRPNGNGFNGRGNGSGGRKLRTVIGGASSNDKDSDHDDLDFDEEFADDEEAPIMDGDEEENKLSEKKLKKEMYKAAHFGGHSDVEDDDGDLDDLFETEKTRKVDKEGEKLRKVLNKTEGGVYDTDDDDKLNPYLSKSDLESDDDSDENDITVKNEPQDESISKTLQDQQQVQQPRSIFASDRGDGFVVIKAPPAFLSNFRAGTWNPNGRKMPGDPSTKLKISLKKEDAVEAAKKKSKSPSPTPTNNSGPVDLGSSGPDGVLVTTKEVLDIVRENPLTIMELLVGLKNRVNAHQDNKQRIISIVKQNLKLVDKKLFLKEEN
ncbi:transcription initiation factor IIF subunit alpha [[Candida] railenensis]|uniref:Transcription initiation factor IIF subunit alpha n=1 Tax=[Candida] railenensis TaxID=45579 RepID=A0A9P0W164_9ASCO|nr:transcription initiation factor IIF subunit alpha [[Candida] railenensis]